MQIHFNEQRTRPDHPNCILRRQAKRDRLDYKLIFNAFWWVVMWLAYLAIYVVLAM